MKIPETVTVETDLFEHREVKPHFINRCCFGEDFAAWMREALSLLTDFSFEYSKIIQEDYGWGFWATLNADRFWISFSYVGDGPQEAPAQWVISVTYDPGLNLMKRFFHKPDPRTRKYLLDQIKRAVSSNTGFKEVPAPSYGA
jgi:hypothetical protein